MSENKSLCSYPWLAARIGPDGLVTPCCFWLDILSSLTVSNSNVSNNPLESAEWDKIREDMLAGVPLKTCEKCYNDELTGSPSARKASLNWFTPTKNKLESLQRIEVSFSNLCNLACVSCDQSQSTKWSTENIKAGKPGSKLISNNFDWTKWDLSKVYHIKIIGGEPFMEQDKFCDLLESVDLSKIDLVVNTNGTVLPNERLKTLIEKCKTVKFLVSLDGIDAVNNWMRWPSKFTEIINGMNIYQQWWGDSTHITLSVNAVVSIFNIFTTEQFIDFMKTNYKNWYVNFNWLSHPEWQAIRELPEDVKNKLISEFTGKKAEVLTHGNNFYTVAVACLKLPGKIGWNIIKNKTINLAKNRKLNIGELLPDFKKVMDNY